MRVTLFIPCFVDLLYPQVGISMVRILEQLGHQVTVPNSPACCGQPAFNTGYWDESRAVADPGARIAERRGSGGHRERFMRRDDEEYFIQNFSPGQNMRRRRARSRRSALNFPIFW